LRFVGEARIQTIAEGFSMNHDSDDVFVEMRIKFDSEDGARLEIVARGVPDDIGSLKADVNVATGGLFFSTRAFFYLSELQEIEKRHDWREFTLESVETEVSLVFEGTVGSVKANYQDFGMQACLQLCDLQRQRGWSSVRSVPSQGFTRL